MINNVFCQAGSLIHRKNSGRESSAFQAIPAEGLVEPVLAGIRIFLLVCIAQVSPVYAAPPALPIVNATHLLDITGPRDDPIFFPSDIAASQHQVCVVDSGKQRLSCFNNKGELLRTISSGGSAPGELLNPVGIGVDGKGRLYVADSGNDRVEIFTADGQLYKIIPIELDDQKIRPIDVLPSKDGNTIYISTNTRHQIMVYDAEGHRKQIFGGGGTSYGEFRYPATMAFTPDNRIAIVDVLNARVQVLMENGEFSVQVGEWGVSPGQLFRPKGIAIDSRGNFYVSDSYVGLVSVFSDEGKFRGILGGDGKEFRMETPVGIAIDDENRLYVAEMRANKVAVYQLEEEK